MEMTPALIKIKNTHYEIYRSALLLYYLTFGHCHDEMLQVDALLA